MDPGQHPVKPKRRDRMMIAIWIAGAAMALWMAYECGALGERAREAPEGPEPRWAPPPIDLRVH